MLHPSEKCRKQPLPNLTYRGSRSAITCQAGLIHCPSLAGFRCPDTCCGCLGRGKDRQESPRRVQRQEALVTLCWQIWTDLPAWVHLSTSQTLSRVVKRPETEMKLCYRAAQLCEHHSTAVNHGSRHLIQATESQRERMCVAPGRYRGPEKVSVLLQVGFSFQKAF